MNTYLLPEHPLVVLPTLAKTIGLKESIFLQQLHYWLQKSQVKYKGRMWVYNTRADWIEQLPFFSDTTLKRTISELREKGIIITRQDSSFNRQNYYSIDYDRLQSILSPDGVKTTQPSVHNGPMIGSKRPNDRVKTTQSLYTDTTTDTKTDTPPTTPPGGFPTRSKSERSHQDIPSGNAEHQQERRDDYPSIEDFSRANERIYGTPLVGTKNLLRSYDRMCNLLTSDQVREKLSLLEKAIRDGHSRKDRFWLRKQVTPSNLLKEAGSLSANSSTSPEFDEDNFFREVG